MTGVVVQVVSCPRCGWSFVGTCKSTDESALRALRAHLADKHHEHPSEAELLALLEAQQKTPQP